MLGRRNIIDVLISGMAIAMVIVSTLMVRQGVIPGTLFQSTVNVEPTTGVLDSEAAVRAYLTQIKSSTSSESVSVKPEIASSTTKTFTNETAAMEYLKETLSPEQYAQILTQIQDAKK